MNFDFNELNEIEFNNVINWSIHLKVILVGLLVAVVLTIGYFFFIDERLQQLTTVEKQEVQLKEDFQRKYQLAANLNLYRDQLAEIELQFAELLQMLPSQNEMPGLLDDLTFVATDAGLRIGSLNWDKEVEQEFYLEYPINIFVEGKYHQLGHFVAGVARLPRIVSLHDFEIDRKANGELVMQIQAKTYRFKENEKIAGMKGGN